MYTRFLNEREISSKARKACDDIQKICDAGDAFTQSGSHRDPVQTLVIRRGSNRDGLITPMIESAAIQAEKYAAGAGELFLRILSSAVIDDIAKKSIGAEPDDEWDKILSKISEISIPSRKRDILRTFDAGSEPYRRIIEKTFATIMSDDKILVKKSPLSATKITRSLGYGFSDLEIDQRFLQKGVWNRKNVRSIIIDGIIENVSEIHRFLEDSSKNRIPCVIFCLDCLPDVMETLTKNYIAGNLDVILVKVPVTEFHVNTLVDLGIIFGIEPIAAARGDTISTGIDRQKSEADRVIISRNQISIERESARKDVHAHTTGLRKRIDENLNLAHILEPRIRSLSSSSTKIEVGIDDQKNDPNIVERLDRTFRSLPKIFKSGFIEKNDFQEFSSAKMCLLFGRNNVVPAEMAYQAIKVFLSTRTSIRSVAAGIETV